MLIFLENNPAKFHSDPTWNDGALGCFEERRHNKNNRKNKKSMSDFLDQFLIQKVVQQWTEEQGTKVIAYGMEIIIPTWERNLPFTGICMATAERTCVSEIEREEKCEVRAR